MGIEENFFDVLFEISSEDRYRILQLLREGPKRVTQLAKILELGHTEISRHISRICDVKLAGRDVDGLYQLTPYGEVVLEQLQGFEFTSRFRDYFASHSLSGLPKEFVMRARAATSRTVHWLIMWWIFSISSKAVSRKRRSMSGFRLTGSR